MDLRLASLPDSARITFVVCLTAVATLIGLLTFPQIYRSAGAVLELDMASSAGGNMEIYINDLRADPLRATLVGGERRVYRFDGILEDIHLLRIDPGEVPGATVDFYGIRVVDAGTPLRSFSPQEILRWSKANIAESSLTNDFVRFVASNNDPILQTGVAITLNRDYPAFLGRFMAGLQQPKSALAVILFTFALGLASGVFDRSRRLHIVAACLAVPACLTALWLTVQIYQPLAPVDASVGRAVFTGFSTPGLRMAIFVTLAVAVLAGLFVSGIHRVNNSADMQRQTADRTGRMARFGTPALLCVLAISAFVPDLRGWLSVLSNQEFATDWDSNNVILWNFLIQSGYVPFRDFWYPYSGFFLFSLTPPYGILAGFLYKTALYCLVLLPLYRLLDRRLLPVLFVLAALWIGESQQVFWGAWRYLIPVAVVFSYVTIARNRPTLQTGHILFWLSVCLGLFFEPAQIIYAGPAIAVILAFDIVQGRIRKPADIVARLMRDFIVPALFLGVLIAVAAWAGQLPGAFDFYRLLGPAAVGGATPNDMLAAIAARSWIKAANLLLPLCFVAIGLYERLKKYPGDRKTADLMLGLGLVGYMMMQKHLLRPADWQMIVVPALGVFLYAAIWRIRRPLPEYIGLGVAAGWYIAIAVNTGGAAALLDKLYRAPAALTDSVAVLYAEQALIRDTAERMFHADRFTAHDDAKRVLAELARRGKNGVLPDFYVLGDSPYYYVLAKRLPPYHVNDYNAASLPEQLKVATYLEREKPEYVIWDPATLTMDGIQNFVRNPTIYNAVVEGYRPGFRVGRFEVLERRPEGAPLSMAYFHEKFGATAYLGTIPYLSSFGRFGRCPGQAAQCRKFLRVEITDWEKVESTLAIPIRSGGHEFRLVFALRPPQAVYHISLNRIWFWDVAARHGGKPTVIYNALPSGVKTAVLSREARPDILY